MITPLNIGIYGLKYNPFKLSDFIAYWKLNANSNDSIDSLNGTNTNITFATATGSAYSNAATFTPSTPAIVNFGDNDVFSFTDGLENDKPFSFSVSVNFGTIVLGNYYQVFSKGIEYRLQFHNSGTLYFNCFGSGGSDIGIVGAAPVGGFISNTWYHIVMTYNGNKTTPVMELYIDKQKKGAFSVTGAYTGMANTTGEFRLGVSSSGGLQFKGQQCQFALYNRVLTQTDVDYLHGQMINGQNII